MLSYEKMLEVNNAISRETLTKETVFSQKFI